MNIHFDANEDLIMASIEIHVSAEQLLRRHGHDAWAQTVAGAEASAAMGDWEQVGHWRQIGGVVRSLERRGPLSTVPRRALAAIFAAPRQMFQPSDNPAFS